MEDKSSVIFGNPMPKKVVKGAIKSKKKYIKKYGDDSNTDYKISFEKIPTLDFLGVNNIVFGESLFNYIDPMKRHPKNYESMDTNVCI